MTLESRTEELLASIAEYDGYRTASGYYMGRAIAELLAIGYDRKQVSEMVLDRLKVKLNGSQITKFASYAALPDSPASKALSLTRAYYLASHGVSGWSDDALRAADPTDPYTWSAFDAEWCEKLPPEEKEWCECPVCSHRHPLSKKKPADSTL